MYHKATPSSKNASPELLKEWFSDSDSGSKKTENLIRLHVFGDKYGITGLKSATVLEFSGYMHSGIFRLTCTLPSCSQITYAYDNLPAESSFLTLLCNLYHNYADVKTWNENASKFPHTFLASSVVLYAARK